MPFTPENLKPIKYMIPFDLAVQLSDRELNLRKADKRMFQGEVSRSYELWRSATTKTESSWFKFKEGKAFNWAYNRNYEDLLGEAWYKAKYGGADKELKDVLFEMRRNDIESRWNARREKRGINPDKVQEQIEKPKLEDTKTRHKVEKLKQESTTQQPAKRMDQKTRRKASARKARPVNEVNTDKLTPKTNDQKARKQHSPTAEKLARQEKVRTDSAKVAKKAPSEGSATNKSAEEVFSKTKDKPKGRVGDKVKTASKNIKSSQRDKLGPGKGGGWKLFEKDVKGMYRRSSRFLSKLSKESQVGKFAANLFKQKWARKTAGSLAVTLAINLAMGAIRRSIAPQPAIPDEYERGYDLISEYTSDFGSPLKLARTAHKSMRPYYSSVRSSLKTNVNTVIGNNVALKAHKQAIGHTRY